MTQIRCMCVSCASSLSLLCLCVVICYAWPRACLGAWVCVRNCITNSPSHHYEEVQAVPCVSKVTLLAKYPQSQHLDHHLNSEESEDEMIEVLQKKMCMKKLLVVQ